jgi:small subunit ribosomal protein S21
MIEVRVNKGDDFDKIVKRFKKLCDNDGFVKEILDRKYYKKPSEKNREDRRRKERLFAQLKRGYKKDY